MEPNLAGSIYVRSSIKKNYLIPFGQQTWPLLLKIEHRVKLHVFGNNSKTVNNIRNLTWVKMISTGRSNYPEIVKKIWLPILELLPFFRQMRILHRCFLPSLVPFGQAVSEEKIFFNISQSETRIALGGHICWRNGTKWRNFIEDLI
jgi:hypothetical protein